MTKKSFAIEKPKVENEGIKKTKIRVIGIGGGGGSIVSEIAPGMSKASFAAANTDLQALKSLGKKVLRFQFGENLTHGLGTGMNADFGRDAALEAKEKIQKLLEGQDLCILVASLGGGAGSGAAPIFAKISKSLGNLTYGIFTLPFKFEGEKKMEIAKDALKKIKNSLNAITIIPNERVFQIIDKDTPLKQALSVINKNLAESLGGLIETIYEPGLINIDFADFRTILEGQGRLVYLNTAEVQRKEGSIKELIDKVLSSPLYSYNIRGAKGVLFNIAGEKNLSLFEVSQISKTISELVHPEAKIIFGISQNPKYSEIIKTTLLANGCGMKLFSRAQVKGRRRGLYPLLKPSLTRAAAKSVEERSSPTGEEKKQPVHKKRINSSSRSEERRRAKLFDKKISAVVKGAIEEKEIPEKKKIIRESSSSADAQKRRKAEKSEKEEPKKIAIEFVKQEKEKETAPIFSEEEKLSQVKQVLVQNGGEEKIRKNAIQIKKEIEEIEREIAEKERFWETPAYLRRKTGKA
ncbi:MAG: cell division protein FtsZ [bacterium]|nr:cell division protein FtsZ [bacterium]